MRAVGIDLGARRIGVAVSDSGGVLASPHDTVERSGAETTDHRRIAEIVREVGAGVVVVGLPLSLSGGSGPAARAVLAEVERLRTALTVPVETIDERFSTVTAERGLRTGGVKGKARRRVVDRTAAAVILQAWLDGAAARQGGHP